MADGTPVEGAAGQPATISALVGPMNIDPKATYSGKEVEALLEKLCRREEKGGRAWTASYRSKSTIKRGKKKKASVGASSRKRKLSPASAGKGASREGCWFYGLSNHFKDECLYIHCR